MAVFYSERELLEFLGLESLPSDFSTGLIEGLFSVECWKKELGFLVEEPKELDPKLILPHPYNSLIYPRTDISVLTEQIQQSNWIRPILINRKRQAVSGNSRLAAALNLRLKRVPVEVCCFGTEAEELTRLILENSGRVKTTEERVREGEVLSNAASWLQTQKRLKQRKLVEEVRFYLESRKDERFFLLTGEVDRDFALIKEWGIDELHLKISHRTRDLVAEATGLGSGENFRQAAKVVRAIDLFGEWGRRVEAETLRSCLNGSVNKAVEMLRDLERLEEARYRYTGEEIKGAKCLLLKGSICFPGQIKLKDKNMQAVIEGDTEEVFFVRWIDLELLGLEKNKRPKNPPKNPKPNSPAPVSVPVSEEVKPKFAVGDKVWLIYRERTAVVEKLQWTERQEQWLYHLRLGEDKVDCLLEDHLEVFVEGSFVKGDWVTDGGSMGVVCEEPINNLKDVMVRWLGMGAEVAPKEGDCWVVCSDLRSVAFDPFSPPKYVLQSFRVGDLVSARSDKACTKRGKIVAFEEDGWLIYWGGSNGRLKDHQIQLASVKGFSVGDEVMVFWEGTYSGNIVGLFRGGADVLLSDGRRCRVPLDWLKLSLPLVDLVSAVKEYLAEQEFPHGVATAVVNFANYNNGEALRHLRAVAMRLNMMAEPVGQERERLLEAFRMCLADYGEPNLSTDLVEFEAIESEQELVEALHGLSLEALEASVLRLWKLARAEKEF